MDSMEGQQSLLKRPLLEHYQSLRGYSTIASFAQPGTFVDLIAIVASFTEIKPTRGQDMQRGLIVCDPTKALANTGLLVQFYKPFPEDLPRPAQGSVIILKSFKLFDYRTSLQAWSHNTSNWIIYDANGMQILSKSKKTLTDPDHEVAVYVERLAKWWKTRAGLSSTTELALPPNLNSTTAHSLGRATITVQEIKENLFFDLIGYVVKSYPTRSNAHTIYVTDYTQNSQLHEYTYGDSAWKGPFGQQTIQITLWDANAYFAQQYIHDDQFVQLRNVQGKRSNAGRLEGAIRGDRKNSDKVNVVRLDYNDPLVKAIKLRKKQYEDKWHIEKEQIDEAIRMEQQAERVLQLTPPTSVNPNLETSYQQVPTTAIGDILEPPYVPQAERNEGAAGRKQPHRFRTVGRIVDFWPADLRDFSKPFCMACQATYTPSHPSATKTVQKCPVCGTERGQNDPDTHEFAFTILVEGQDSVCIPVIFCGDDIETLLGPDIEPCNLYLPENGKMLSRLREKLFLLWGNLEERFSPPGRPQGGWRQEFLEPPLMWNEICVMEYWVNEKGGEAGWRGRRFRGFGMRIL